MSRNEFYNAVAKLYKQENYQKMLSILVTTDVHGWYDRPPLP